VVVPIPIRELFPSRIIWPVPPESFRISSPGPLFESKGFRRLMRTAAKKTGTFFISLLLFDDK